MYICIYVYCIYVYVYIYIYTLYINIVDDNEGIGLFCPIGRSLSTYEQAPFDTHAYLSNASIVVGLFCHISRSLLPY